MATFGWGTTGTTTNFWGGGAGNFTFYSPVAFVDPDAPLLIGNGQAQFSTCTDLVVSPQWCWDANGYYRSLGVHWKADRKTLRKAFQAAGGPDSQWLTYVLTQLLNPVVRRAYNRTPLGCQFVDQYVMTEIKRALLQATAARRAAGQSDAVVSDIGRSFVDEAGQDTRDDSGQVLDDESEEVHDDVTTTGRDSDVQPAYPFAYYVWRSSCRDTHRLMRWMDLLVRAFAERGLAGSLALGYRGHTPHRWMLGKVGYRDVVYLNDTVEPDEEMAQAVARQWSEDHSVG